MIEDLKLNDIQNLKKKGAGYKRMNNFFRRLWPTMGCNTIEGERERERE